MDTNEVARNNDDDLDRMVERAFIAAIMRCKPIAKTITGHDTPPAEASVNGTMPTEQQGNKNLQTMPRTGRSTANVVDETPESTLWSVAQAAKFLSKSERWLFGQLRIDESKVGSIPHVRLGRSLRFIPADLREWSAAGFPPAAAFNEMKDAEKRKRGRN